MRLVGLLPPLLLAGAAAGGALVVVNGGAAEQPAVAGAGASAIEEVAGAADELRGQRVVLTGVVDERYGRRAFGLADGRGEEVVVLLPAKRTKKVERVTSGTVRVSGTVRRIGVDLKDVLRGDYLVRTRTAGIDADAVERVEARSSAASTDAP